MKKLVAACLAAGLASLAGCNTVDGIGQDLSGLGDAMSKASRDARDGSAGDNGSDEELVGGPTYSRRP